jgi:Subtilase family
MTDATGPGGEWRPHLVIPNQPTQEAFQRRGGGGSPGKLYSIPNQAQHAADLRGELESAVLASQHARGGWADDLQSDGVVLAVEGWPGGFELALESLDLRSSKVELLSVTLEGNGRPEHAIVLVPYNKVEIFFKRLHQYANEHTLKGRPKNEPLLANIQAMSVAAIPQLWTDAAPFPDGDELIWWELWLRRTGDEARVLASVAERFGWEAAQESVLFPRRFVTAVRARASELGSALGSRLPIAELRQPRLSQSPAELPLGVQRELVADLAGRLIAADGSSPTVCLLDTGVHRHSLLAASLEPRDILHVVGPDGVDRSGHGTELAGLALLGELTEPLTSGLNIELAHRLESVKILPDPGMPANPRRIWASVTASGVAAPEVDHPTRRRVFCLANSDHGYNDDGRPTSWSATVDALAFGTDIAPTAQGVELLSAPNPNSSRLIVVAAGNVRDGFAANYLDRCDTLPVEDPAQAWNALTVGAYTELLDIPTDPSFTGWTPLARSGDLSPFSRTSMTYRKPWPKKPDIVLEGGNVLMSPAGTSFDTPETLSLVTTSRREPFDEPLTVTRETSAAAAQAARLAAIASSRYPSLWPESLRGLLVHSAEWTEAMRDAIRAAPSQPQRRQLIRRYGFGVPTEDSVLRSASSAVTLIAQSTIRPFVTSGADTKLREMNLHELPWPRKELLALGDTQVRLRVTLSYFIEPNPSARGWKGRYQYASHGLRFGVRHPGESLAEFRRRLNKLAVLEEAGAAPPQTGQRIRWFVGETARNLGSLHADMWKGTAADLADCGIIGVFPVGGWWKLNNQRERTEIPVRYCLLVSLMTPAVGIDLYSPIAAQIRVPIAIDTQ